MAIETTIVFLVSFALYLPYLSQQSILDETDTMIGGKVVADGGLIYQDYLSQHTPFAYWFSALGRLFGADGLAPQRMFVYGLFALALAFIYLRNSPRFGRMPLIVTILTVVTFHFANAGYSYAVLSDNYEAICVVALAFEFLALAILRRDTLSSWIVMAVASVIAVGSAFVSIYFVFGVLVASALVSVLNARKLKVPAGKIVKRLALRAAIVAAPFAVVALYLAITGTLRAAYDEAYVLNVTYYARYLGDLGPNPAAPLIDGIVSTGQHLLQIPELLGSASVAGPGQAVGLIAVILSSAILIRLRPVAGIAYLYLFTLTTLRGWQGFHAQPVWAVFAVSLGVIAWFVFVRSGALFRRRVVAGAAAVVFAVLAVVIPSAYVVRIGLDRSALFTMPPSLKPVRTEVIATLVPAGEKYGEMGISNGYDFVYSDRSPAGGFAGWVPWFTDMLEPRMIEGLAADNPVLIFHDPQTDVLGNTLATKAPTLDTYIRTHYERVNLASLGITEGVYIRNDAVPAAIQELENHRFPGAQFVELPN